MVKALTTVQMVQITQENGKKNKRMATVQKNGLMVQPLKVITVKEKSMDKGYLNGVMVVIMKESSLKMKFKE